MMMLFGTIVILFIAGIYGRVVQIHETMKEKRDNNNSINNLIQLVSKLEVVRSGLPPNEQERLLVEFREALKQGTIV